MCLGLAGVDSGHSRVPAPPARITGRICRPLFESLMRTPFAKFEVIRHPNRHPGLDPGSAGT